MHLIEFCQTLILRGFTDEQITDYAEAFIENHRNAKQLPVSVDEWDADFAGYQLAITEQTRH